MVRIEPFVILDGLARVLEKVLGYVDLHRVPDVEIGDAALRQHCRAELILLSWNPFRLCYVVGQTNVKDLFP